MFTTGAGGVTGWLGIAAALDATDVQPDDANVTVKVYVTPAVRLLIVVVVVEPVTVAPPGETVTVQLLAGRLLNATLAVAKAHVGPVMAPATGAGGVIGCAGITALVDDTDVQPDEVRVTVNV